MKKIIFLSIILISNFIQSQELNTIKLLPPESQEYVDLHFLKDELEGKRLVMLGEMTHMYGNIFEMKARIVEYLHKELGYTTIAMESSIYDLWLMNKKEFSTEEFNNAIWGVWSGAEEFQRLVKYIKTNNIKIVGFDSQFNNSQKFLEDFLDYLEDSHIELKQDEDDFAIVIEGVLENLSFEEDDIKYADFEKEMNRIINIIAKFNQTEINYYWLQFTKSLLSTTKDVYYNNDEIETDDFANSNHNFRDAQMADNLLSYLARNPNEKVICWADNIHIINKLSSVKKPIISEFISMGTTIRLALKNEVYSLATLHANDSIFVQKKWHSTPVVKGSFEDKLNTLNTPYLFISSSQLAMHKLQKSRLLHFTDFTDINLSELHDGYVFFKNATLPKHEITQAAREEEEEEEQPEEKVLEIIKPISRGVKSILKGQIIDASTKTFVPFATLIMKKEEIYRVADENGYFELPVTNKMIKTSSVSISSVGFESKHISLNTLTKEVLLTPKFEDLDEVIIKGYTSPKTVLKIAIKNITLNHPIAAHNYQRYSKIIYNKNDETLLDLELITKDYDEGYTSPYIITRKVEQVKWNKNIRKKLFKYTSQFFSYRQNAIRYSNILHKRKYKKFNLKFIKSKKPEDIEFYIIEFKTDRNKWNYTNRSYPTQYSGKVYIRRDDFVIIKVIENWATTLNKEEIKIYSKNNYSFKNFAEKKQVTLKEENICIYSKEINSRNYASNYFRRTYVETIDNDDKLENLITEINSNLYDYKTENIEEFKFEYYKKDRKLTVLKRVGYNSEFWNSFYKSFPNVITK